MYRPILRQVNQLTNKFVREENHIRRMSSILKLRFSFGRTASVWNDAKNYSEVPKI